MPGEVLKISKRYSQPNLSYWRKPTGGGGPLGLPSSGRGLIDQQRFALLFGEKHIPSYRHFILLIPIIYLVLDLSSDKTSFFTLN